MVSIYTFTIYNRNLLDPQPDSEVGRLSSDAYRRRRVILEGDIDELAMVGIRISDDRCLICDSKDDTGRAAFSPLLLLVPLDRIGLPVVVVSLPSVLNTDSRRLTSL